MEVVTGRQIFDLAVGLVSVAYGSLGLLWKSFEFPTMGFWSQMIFGKDGTLPRWLGASFYLALGSFLIYLAFAK